jgi:hypothetical protein
MEKCCYVSPFDSEDKNSIKEQIRMDFVHKLWQLYYDNMYNNMLHFLSTYSSFEDKFYTSGSYIGYKSEDSDIDLNSADEINLTCKLAEKYINERIDALKIDSSFKVTKEAVRKMFSAGEFPFLRVKLWKRTISHGADDILLSYTITR